MYSPQDIYRFPKRIQTWLDDFQVWGHDLLMHVAEKESMCFCHVPTVWLPVETAEKMVAWNVNYIIWIIIVLGVNQQ